MTKSTRALALLGMVTAVAIFPVTALADGHGGRDRHPHAVPEINGSNAAVALALVAGGAAVVLGRRRRQTR